MQRAFLISFLWVIITWCLCSTCEADVVVVDPGTGGIAPGAPAINDGDTLCWGTGGLDLITLDQSDSIWLAEDPYRQAFEAVINPDRSYFFTHAILTRLSDSVQITLQDYAGDRPAGTFGCGFLFVSFNPKATEMLFNQTCDGDYPSGGEFVVDRVGTFNYTTNEFTIIDTLIGIESCTAPVYAPDGRKIAFLDNDDYKAYIIYRELIDS